MIPPWSSGVNVEKRLPADIGFKDEDMYVSLFFFYKGTITGTSRGRNDLGFVHFRQSRLLKINLRLVEEITLGKGADTSG